jgi:hypothetical protein
LDHLRESKVRPGHGDVMTFDEPAEERHGLCHNGRQVAGLLFKCRFLKQGGKTELVGHGQQGREDQSFGKDPLRNEQADRARVRIPARLQAVNAFLRPSRIH